MNDNNILAVILAGGKSKRFGEDKNLAKLGSKSLLEHVIKRVREKFQKILIISNKNHKFKKMDHIDIIPDCIEGKIEYLSPSYKLRTGSKRCGKYCAVVRGVRPTWTWLGCD